MSETTLRDFVPLEKLGQGSFSTVYKVKRLSDSKIYALKKVRMNNLKDKQKLSAVNEIRILASLDSPYIVAYKQAIYDEKLNLLCIVMEYANGGDLQRCIKKAEVEKVFINEKEIWKAVIHILRGLDRLHKKNILHRDLKSANIFLSDGLYKLGDLNVSKVNKGRLAYTQIGTPYYASPEVWREQPYDNKSDIWSFGVIIYEMATLRPPFHGHDMEQLYDNVQRGVYNKLPSCYSKDLQTVIDCCLRKSPSLRPSAEQLLQHPTVMKYVQKYINQQDLAQETQPNLQEQLLRTIKVPFNMKGLQKNLPRSKYQNASSKEDSSVEKTVEDKYTPKSINPIRLGRILSRSPSQQIKPTLDRYSPRNIQMSLNNAGSHRNYVNNIISNASPRNKVEPIKLSQARSLDRLQSSKRQPKKSDRYITQSKIDNLANYKVEQLKEIQRSLVLQQNQIEEYIQKQLKQRPTTCIPKTEHGRITNNRSNDPGRYDYERIQQRRRNEPNEQSRPPQEYRRKIEYTKPRESSLQHMKQEPSSYSSKILEHQSSQNKLSSIVSNRGMNRKIEAYKYPSTGIAKVGQYKSKLSPSYWVQ